MNQLISLFHDLLYGKEGETMIFDSIRNADIYKAISPNLAAALEYMQENDLEAMEPGRYPVADGKVLVIIKKGYYGTATISITSKESPNHFRTSKLIRITVKK